MRLEIIVANYLDKNHGLDIVSLLNAYGIDEMGGGAPLDKNLIANVPAELSKLPHAFSVLAYVDKKPAGLVNCFMGFSTFACKPLVNIHDMIVMEEFREKGISHKMLEKVEEIAIRRGCCKLTLEVLSGNEPAKSSYRKFGFSGYQLNSKNGEAQFWQKSLEAI